MFAKIIIFGAFVAAASAGIAAPLAYSAPIAHSPYAYSSYSHTPLSYSAPIAHAPLSYSAPIAHAPLSYSAPIAHAPVAYSAPVAHAPLAYSAPIAKAAVVADAYDPHPQYSYGYGVQDGLTGDNKQQQETRDGDVVQGSYSLIDADGFRRTVDYTADPLHGFNAVVRREPLGAQVVAKVAAPVAYAAPIAKVAYAQPIAKVAAPLGYTTYHH